MEIKTLEDVYKLINIAYHPNHDSYSFSTGVGDFEQIGYILQKTSRPDFNKFIIAKIFLDYKKVCWLKDEFNELKKLPIFAWRKRQYVCCARARGI